MEAFSVLSGISVPLAEANIDTNQICPTRFNKVPRGPRFAQILMHDRRFNADGSEKPDYILNQEPYRHAVIAVAGRNFGRGHFGQQGHQSIVARLDGTLPFRRGRFERPALGAEEVDLP